MGCCYSCKDDDSSQNNETNERTHLLVDPVCNTMIITQEHNEDFLRKNPNSLPKNTDERSALNRIIQETVSNIIDIAALDSHTLEKHECTSRAKHYKRKVQTAFKPKTLNYGPYPFLLEDVPYFEETVAKNPIHLDDYTMVDTLVSQAASAVNELKVVPMEDLVVPFKIS